MPGRLALCSVTAHRARTVQCAQRISSCNFGDFNSWTLNSAVHCHDALHRAPIGYEHSGVHHPTAPPPRTPTRTGSHGPPRHTSNVLVSVLPALTPVTTRECARRPWPFPGVPPPTTGSGPPGPTTSRDGPTSRKLPHPSGGDLPFHKPSHCSLSLGPVSPGPKGPQPGTAPCFPGPHATTHWITFPSRTVLTPGLDMPDHAHSLTSSCDIPLIRPGLAPRP